MIQFHQVKKIYPGNEFELGEINLQIDPGEFMFLIGPSGSGKTTLIRLLIREEVPTTGKIFLDDYDITKLSRNKVYQLRRQIGVIFQDYKLIPDKNAYENVAFAMEAAGRSDKEIKETVPYVLDIVGLSTRAQAFPEQLSGGEKQRVAIARAVANNPRVLIADEPTGNLDPAAAWDIVQILSKINNWGTTVIMSTHGSDIVNTLNKRVVQMKAGQVVRDDKQGFYERTDFKPQDQAALAEQAEAGGAEKKKGPIKVRLSSVQAEPEQQKSKLSRVLNKFGWSSKKRAAKVEAPGSEKEAKQILKDADNTPVEALDLRPEIVADLKTAGYDDVEDIISAGPEALANQLVIDPQEVVVVAKAVTEFVETEEHPKPDHKEDKKEKPPGASQKVKLDLTAKPAKK